MHSSISVQVPSEPEVYPSTQRHLPSSAHSIFSPQLSTLNLHLAEFYGASEKLSPEFLLSQIINRTKDRDL